ncbi:alpha-1,2 glucosyltransferase ALG10, partial [Reticulomyxa filosa]
IVYLILLLCLFGILQHLIHAGNLLNLWLPFFFEREHTPTASSSGSVPRWSWRRVRVVNVTKFMLIMVGVAAIMNWFQVVHPFLLSDNRHYSFYVWRYFLSRSRVVFCAIVPLASAAIIYCYLLIKSAETEFNILIGMSTWWMCSFGLCTCLTLILTPLFEFRYFIIPIVIFKLEFDLRIRYTNVKKNDDSNNKSGSTWLEKYLEVGNAVTFDSIVHEFNCILREQFYAKRTRQPLFITTWLYAHGPFVHHFVLRYINIIFYIFVDVVIFYVFLIRPFQWNDGTTARFMW